MKHAFLVVLLACCVGMAYGQQPSNHGADTQSTPDQFRAALLDFDQTIQILEKGTKQHWNQKQFQEAFGVNVDSAGAMHMKKPIVACAVPVQRVLSTSASGGTSWDEHLPFPVEARRALDQCRSLRNLFAGQIPPAS